MNSVVLQLILMAVILLVGFLIIWKRSEDTIRRHATVIAFLTLVVFIAIYSVLVITRQAWTLLVVFLPVAIIVPTLVYLVIVKKNARQAQEGLPMTNAGKLESPQPLKVAEEPASSKRSPAVAATAKEPVLDSRVPSINDSRVAASQTIAEHAGKVARARALAAEELKPEPEVVQHGKPEAEQAAALVPQSEAAEKQELEKGIPAEQETALREIVEQWAAEIKSQEEMEAESKPVPQEKPVSQPIATQAPTLEPAAQETYGFARVAKAEAEDKLAERHAQPEPLRQTVEAAAAISSRKEEAEAQAAVTEERKRFDACMANAAVLREKGLSAAAADLYSRAIKIAEDKPSSRKASFNALSCYLKVKNEAKAHEIADQMRSEMDEMSDAERVKLRAILSTMH